MSYLNSVATAHRWSTRSSPPTNCRCRWRRAGRWWASPILAGFREARPDIPVDDVLTPAGRDAADHALTVCKTDLDRLWPT